MQRLVLGLVAGLAELAVRVGELRGALEAGQGRRSKAGQKLEHLGVFIGEFPARIVGIDRQRAHQPALVQQRHRHGGAHADSARRGLGGRFRSDSRSE